MPTCKIRCDRTSVCKLNSFQTFHCSRSTSAFLEKERRALGGHGRKKSIGKIRQAILREDKDKVKKEIENGKRRVTTVSHTSHYFNFQGTEDASSMVPEKVYRIINC